MSFTYAPESGSDLAFIRLLVDDTEEVGAELSDEEIALIVARQTATGAALPYYAAAECLQALHTRWMSSGKGKVSKKVSKLTVVYGSGSGINADAAIAERIKELRRRGSFLLSSRPYALKAL